MAKLAWKERIKRARAKGKFSRSAKSAAAHWPSCAVGERVLKLSSRDSFSPHDVFDALGDVGDNLRDLGMTFHYAVKSNDVKRAAAIHKEIQAVELPN